MPSMNKGRMALRVGRALWRSGLLRLWPSEIVDILKAWWRCRNSFAFLSAMAAIRGGSRVALQDDDGPLTFAQLHLRSLALAHHLVGEAGVGPGTQVALIGHNGRGFVTALLACTRLGADVLPLAPGLPKVVLEAILERQKISLLLHDSDLAEALAMIAPGLSRLAIDTSFAATASEPPAVRRGGDLIVLTSGTTGLSKGIRRRPTLGQLLPLLTGLLESIPIEMHRPIVLAIPLHHGYGIATLAMSLALGAPLQLGQRYDIAPLLGRLSTAERPFLVTVPTLLARWLRPAVTGPRPAAVITGSAPLDATLCREILERLGPILFNLYGSSEAGLIALALPETLLRAPGSVGQLLPGNHLRLVDGSGNHVCAGEIGRIFVRGAFVIPSQADGWRETGDLGRTDESGNLYVCGRADSMFVSGGENVYPHELEEALAEHPALTEVAVLVVDDAEFGQRMVAAVVLAPDTNVEPERLREWLKERLERHKMPRQLKVLQEIPRNALGKVDRVALGRLMEAPEPNLS